ncbi:MAG: M12 family metallo-peptidase [Ramlibacter sp.]
MLVAEEKLNAEGALAAGTWGAAASQTVISFPYTGDYRIDALLQGAEGETGVGALDYRWNAPSALGATVTVTYSFMTLKPWYGGTDDGDGDTGFGEFTTAQKTAVRAIMDRLEAELGINFTEVSDSQSSFGKIRFGNNHQEVSAGYAWLPNSTGDGSDANLSGDVWISDDGPSYVTPVAGNNAWDTLVHEIGHALGLKHPGNYNAGSGQAPEPGNYLGTAEDNYDYTVMSYEYSPNGHQLRDWYGIYDLLALKKLYGAGTYGAGDTVYSYGNSAGANRQVIDDASGFDTLDLSSMTSIGSTVDLRPGGFSSVGQYAGSPAVGNLSIDFTTIIEKFIGTAREDSVIGNDASNIFVLGAGGNDADGGNGIDTVIYPGGRDGFSASMWDGTVHVTSAGSVDTLVNVERVDFTDVNLAFDLAGHAGTVAKLIGALFGAGAVQVHPEYVGIGLGLIDGGMSEGTLTQYAINARFGASHTHGDLVTTLYTNVAGVAPSPELHASFTSQLDGGTQTEPGLALFAAEHAVNAQNIGLVGLTQTGLAYV